MDASTLAPPLSADLFWRQVALNAVSPIVAAVFGGLIVGFIVRRAQNHRADLALRTSISIDMMQVAYGFYTKLIEVIRRERYGQEVNIDDLPERYEDFRIAARVLEAKLHAYVRDSEARWLWHGVVDLVSLRYYSLVHRDSIRLNDMINYLAQQAENEEIPTKVRSLFLSPTELHDREVLYDTALAKADFMLDRATQCVLNRRLRSSATLSAAQGSQLSVAEASEAADE